MNAEQLKDTLQRSSLFQGIDVLQIEQFIETAPYKIEEYTKSDIIALMGDPLNHLLLVLQGNCIARMVSDSGKYIQIEKIGEGRVLAPAMLFATQNVFPVNVIPEDRVILLRMTKRELVHAMQADEQLMFNFIRIVSDINQFLSHKIHFLSLTSLRGKLAQYMLTLSEEQDCDTHVTIPLTRQELADKFGVSRQSLIRSLTELEDEGLIGVDNRIITLLDKNKLELED